MSHALFCLRRNLTETVTASVFASPLPSVKFCVDVGGAVIFDYRLYHRGLANNSATMSRPMLYLTFAKSWFSDTENFDLESLAET